MSQSQPRLKTSAMIASIADEGQATVPAPFGVALSKLAAQRPEIVGMTADLSKYTDLHIFAQAFPDRFFQMGMAEQLLMAAAGGMAKGFRKRAVCEASHSATVSGVPETRISPPPLPPSGPRSTIQSAVFITSRLCSITTMVLP